MDSGTTSCATGHIVSNETYFIKDFDHLRDICIVYYGVKPQLVYLRRRKQRNYNFFKIYSPEVIGIARES